MMNRNRLFQTQDVIYEEGDLAGETNVLLMNHRKLLWMKCQRQGVQDEGQEEGPGM